MLTQVTYDIDHISLLQDSAISSALMLGSHHHNDIHQLGQRNLVIPNSLPKVFRQSIPTTCAHLGLNSLYILQKGFIIIGDISKVILVKW